MEQMDPIMYSMLSIKIIPAVLIFIASSALAGRVILFYLKRGTLYFTSEFSIRVRRHLRGEYSESYRKGMFDTVRFLSDKTIYDIFELRRLNHRRRFDNIKSRLDSLFFIDHGAAVFFDDLTDQVSYIGGQDKVDWERFVRFILVTNPVFNHLFGIISIELVEKFYKLLPFIVSSLGLFGTVYAYGEVSIHESFSYLFWGIGIGITIAFSNAVFHTHRYDKIVVRSLSWSMFLLWSNRVEVSMNYSQSVDEQEDESAHLFGSQVDLAMATEETFKLLNSDELPPDIPEAA
jgi:hypothetical protein